MNNFKHLIGPFAVIFSLFSSAAWAGTITVTPSDSLRNSKGTLRCALWTEDLGFPVKPDNASVIVTAAVSGNTATCSFTDVQAGKYAVSILHDENNNKNMDLASYGPPLEGYGVSNNADPLPTSLPTFDGALFDYDGSAVSLSIKMFYLLAEGQAGPPTQ